jgi:capsular exopolysaccharide synthesis family protein
MSTPAQGDRSVSTQTTDVREYLRVLRARKWSVILVALLAVGAAGVYVARATREYTAATTVRVLPVENPLSPTVTNPNFLNTDLNTERLVVHSPRVAMEVQAELHITTPAISLLKHLAVNVITVNGANTQGLQFQFTDPSAATAAKVANGFAAAYTKVRGDDASGLVDSAEAPIKKQIDSLNKQINLLTRQIVNTQDQTTKLTLGNRLQSLQNQLSSYTQQYTALETQRPGPARPLVQVLSPANVPSSPSNPKVVRDFGLALAAGLALGIGLAFLRETLDDNIKSREEMERRLGAPVIAAVPRQKGWRKAGEAQLVVRSDPKNPVSEAYRTLGTNIQYLSSRQKLQIIMITSAMGSEGKTTTAANLSVVLAQSGRRVILVSADLRRSRVHSFFGMPNKVGLSDALADFSKLPDAISDPGIDHLRIISGGPVPPDPAALLAGQNAVSFLDSLREMADFVILDTPPILAVADASILAPLTDGAVYVLNADTGSRSAMSHARDQLENAGAKIIGGVYNNFDPSNRAGYSSYYYYYQYYGTPEPSGNGNGTGRGRLFRRKPKEGSTFVDQR